MYTITISSVYTKSWKENHSSKRAAKSAYKFLLSNMAYGETITMYSPTGTVIYQQTR